jgi:hypothetical protein
MFNTGEVIKKAIEELKVLHGDDFKFEDGDVFIFSLKNCALILSNDDGNLKIEFTGNTVIDLDMSCSIYVEERSD